MTTKNTTLARKPSNTMSKNAGLDKPKRLSDQAGDGESFAFAGQMGDGVNRSASTDRFAGNQSGLTMRENYGTPAAARKGNASDSSKERRESTGPSATKDSERMTIATASQGGVLGAGFKCPPVGNPDKIYITKATR